MALRRAFEEAGAAHALPRLRSHDLCRTAAAMVAQKAPTWWKAFLHASTKAVAKLWSLLASDNMVNEDDTDNHGRQ